MTDGVRARGDGMEVEATNSELGVVVFRCKEGVRLFDSGCTGQGTCNGRVYDVKKRSVRLLVQGIGTGWSGAWG